MCLLCVLLHLTMHVWAADERLQDLWVVECTIAIQVIKCNTLF